MEGIFAGQGPSSGTEPVGIHHPRGTRCRSSAHLWLLTCENAFQERWWSACGTQAGGPKFHTYVHSQIGMGEVTGVALPLADPVVAPAGRAAAPVVPRPSLIA